MTDGGAIPRIHLVDDDPAVLRALVRLLMASGYVCETYPSADAFLSQPPSGTPGCVIVDLHLPGASGLELQERLLERNEALPVIFLTGRGSIETSVRAMKTGAVDYLTKPVDEGTLLAAIATALERGRALRAAGQSRASLGEGMARLTPREREVLAMVVGGRLNKQIAGDLGVAEKTIKVHRARVMQKLGVRTIADLVRLVVGNQA
jgi:FixJ family two-component response regulator